LPYLHSFPTRRSSDLDRRVPLQVPVEQRLHLDLRVIDVAVVVVEHVLAPVRHAGGGRAAVDLVNAVLVIPIDISIAAVDWYYKRSEEHTSELQSPYEL